MTSKFTQSLLSLVLLALLFGCGNTHAQETELDQQVKKFLDSKRGSWRDMNVPKSDGQLLYDIIVKNG